MRVLADRTGLPLVRWHWLRRRATLAALTGDFAGCRRSAAEAAEVAEGWHDESVRGTHIGLLASLALLRGDPAELPSGWTGHGLRGHCLLPVGRAVIAAALTLVGRQEEAAAIYHPLMRAVTELKGLNIAALAYLVEMAPALGDPAGCRRPSSHGEREVHRYRRRRRGHRLLLRLAGPDARRAGRRLR